MATLKTDFENLQTILNNQLKPTVVGEWSICNYNVNHASNGEKEIKIPGDKISFIFTSSGKFMFIINHKD